MTGLLILIGGVALFGYFWFLKNKDNIEDSSSIRTIKPPTQAVNTNNRGTEHTPRSNNKMDKYFGNVPYNKRNSQIETTINQVLYKYDEENLSLTKLEQVPLFVWGEAIETNSIHRPFLMLCAAYAYVYCCNDVKHAVDCGREALSDTDCYHKDHCIGAYKWLANEEQIASHLFDENGCSKIFGNPLLNK